MAHISLALDMFWIIVFSRNRWFRTCPISLNSKLIPTNIVSKFVECVRVLVGGCGRGDCLDTERPNGAHPQVRDSPRDQEATLGHTLIQVVAEIPHTEQKISKAHHQKWGFNKIRSSFPSRASCNCPFPQPSCNHPFPWSTFSLAKLMIFCLVTSCRDGSML